MKVVLASESQSRKRALDMLGLTDEVHPSAIDEKSIRDTDAAALTKKLTEAKARKAARPFDDAVVASGDAVIAKDTKLFEKARSDDEAVEFLRELSDSAFQFVTSLTVLRSDTGRMLSAVETSEIKFRRLEDRGFRDRVARYPVLRYARASRATAFCASLTPSQAATTSSPRCP